jgi:multidrug resistance efflux pump
MMKKVILITVLASGLMVPAAFAACEQGDPPEMPDGATASEAQMADAVRAVKGYIAATEEYQACLTAEGRRGKMDIDNYNKSTDRMEKLAANFNRQLKAYKSRSK